MPIAEAAENSFGTIAILGALITGLLSLLGLLMKWLLDRQSKATDRNTIAVEELTKASAALGILFSAVLPAVKPLLESLRDAAQKRVDAINSEKSQ